MLYNNKAMDALYNDNLYDAQKSFREGCTHVKTYQHYNNLGVFYIKNGIILKNGKVRDGFSLGKKMLEKSLSLHENSKVLNNLGYAEYELGNFLTAKKYWIRSYKLRNEETTLYNIAVTNYRLGLYNEALYQIEKVVETIPEAITMMAFLKLNLQMSSVSDLEMCISNMDFSDKLSFYYQSAQYKKVIDIAQQMKKEHYGLNEDELIILLDSFIRCNMLEEGMRYIWQTEIEPYDQSYAQSLWRKIIALSKNHAKRANIIEGCKFIPIIIDKECEYFGCRMHKTSWL